MLVRKGSKILYALEEIVARSVLTNDQQALENKLEPWQKLGTDPSINGKLVASKVMGIKPGVEVADASEHVADIRIKFVDVRAMFVDPGIVSILQIQGLAQSALYRVWPTVSV